MTQRPFLKSPESTLDRPVQSSLLDWLFLIPAVLPPGPGRSGFMDRPWRVPSRVPGSRVPGQGGGFVTGDRRFGHRRSLDEVNEWFSS